ncbi:MAG: phosphoribosylformylglycinamidine synthase subunit PurL [Helicobacteraceae bacterium]|jgi:phosphoribosylformylglycinamidine synthase|nr:phosphoribosylformylglycinamidine synthase subunit PurL [Helicobacteraceae bacterium]
MQEEIESLLKAHKITNEEYGRLEKILGRKPNLVELGIVGAAWSEHCSYKSSKKYLRSFPTEAAWVVQGPGENAGAIDIGDGYAAIFKMESHNHPSFIEPYQGAATGVGGILRDIFTMGARPIANLNSLRFGDITDRGAVGKLQQRLLRGVSAGISGYGNCVGIAMLGGETTFDERYNGNILVNAFTLGIAKKDRIFYGRSEGAGNPVIYVGSKTGRDGLGGAVMASDSFANESKSKRPTVQVGDPFTEKLLMEACLELFQTDHIVGIQDMGAAGLTSSSFEMASRGGGGGGMRMYLDRVPMREENMTPYDLMLSESQERMLICAKKGREAEVIALFKKYELDAAVIGEVTDTGRMELFWKGDLVANLPASIADDYAPVLDRPIKRPAYLDEIANLEDADIVGSLSSTDALKALLSYPEVADKRFIYEQYDSTIGAGSITKIGESDAGVILVHENGKAIALSVDCNPRFCYINPKIGAAAAVAEAGRNVAMSGATPLALSDCLNFGNPENPEVMWQFKEACEGIIEACLKLKTPVVSGNVSLYNESGGNSIFPTPTIAMVGLLDDPKKTLTMPFKKAGDLVYLLGETRGEFGGSLYMKVFAKRVAGKAPKLDLNTERLLWDSVISANQQGLLLAARDVSVGGIALAVAKMALHGKLGFEGMVTLGEERDLFCESFSRAIVEVSSEKKEAFENLIAQSGLNYEQIGKVTQNDLIINSISLSSAEMRALYFDSFAAIMERDL